MEPAYHLDHPETRARLLELASWIPPPQCEATLDLLAARHGIRTLPALFQLRRPPIAAMQLDATTHAIVDTLSDCAAQLLAPQPICAADLDAGLSNSLPISTGMPSLDAFLGGRGWQRQALYEVSGVSGIGKTHLLLRSAVEAMALGTSVLWIDATASFSIARMVEMVRSHGNSMSLGDMLTRIHIVRCPNLNRYLSVLAAARANILAAQHQQQLQQRSGIYWTHLGLVIVDSIHALVAPALAPSTTGSDLGPLVSSTLANATKEFGVDLDLAIVVTNLATTWRDVAKPALGYAWRFLVDERLVMDEWPSNLDAMTWPPPASRPRRISSDKAQRDIPMPIKLIVQ